jgi:hypothetical protein
MFHSFEIPQLTTYVIAVDTELMHYGFWCGEVSFGFGDTPF